jgi:muramoyltetrapeptide carboxypeptidase
MMTYEKRMTNYPPFLKAGDTIGIAATARWITPEQLQPALDLIHSWGFRTKLADNIHEQRFQLAGDAECRTAAFQRMLDDEDIQAILIVRGGYGTVHLMDALDFSKFENHPKWICGYSDITVLLSEMYARNMACIHSTMPISFPVATPEALENLRLSLTGELREITWKVDTPLELNLNDVVITGGNLSVLYSLLGSSSLKMPDENTVVFIEDVDEMYYHIDRMLMGLMRAGYFDNAKAIVVGGMTMMKDNTKAFGFETENPWGFSPEQAIQRIATEKQIPVVFSFPAGHQNDNRAFYMGVKSELVVREGNATLYFQHEASDKYSKC